MSVARKRVADDGKNSEADRFRRRLAATREAMLNARKALEYCERATFGKAQRREAVRLALDEMRGIHKIILKLWEDPS